MTTMTRRGISRIGVVAAIVCIGILFAIALPLLDRRREIERSMTDSTHLTEIHQAIVTFANEFGGGLSIPGLIDRLPDPYLGDLDGSGPQDASLNTTANLFSAVIAQNYFSPATVISPLERNPVVREHTNYNFSFYDSARDVYWDPAFVADLAVGSNVSYAHMPFAGDRMRRQWREARGPETARFGAWGPVDAVATADSYACRPDGTWRGNVVYADNHIELWTASAGGTISFGATGCRDNPFNVDPDLEGIDQVLAFTKEVRDGTPVLQHD